MGAFQSHWNLVSLFYISLWGFVIFLPALEFSFLRLFCVFFTGILISFLFSFMRNLANISLLPLWSHFPSLISWVEGILSFPVACSPSRQCWHFSSQRIFHCTAQNQSCWQQLHLVCSQNSQAPLNCKEVSSEMTIHMQTAHLWKASCTHLEEELVEAVGKAVYQGLLSWFEYCSVALKLQSLQRWGAAKMGSADTDGSWKAVAGQKMIYC